MSHRRLLLIALPILVAACGAERAADQPVAPQEADPAAVIYSTPQELEEAGPIEPSDELALPYDSDPVDPPPTVYGTPSEMFDEGELPSETEATEATETVASPPAPPVYGTPMEMD